jgi:hypothetical protein
LRAALYPCHGCGVCGHAHSSRAKRWRRDFVTYVSQHRIHLCTVISELIKEI